MPKSDFVSVPSSCTLCPRRCGADRAAGRTGFCGAGDTSLSAFSAAIAAKTELKAAAQFAGLASGVTVRKIGVTGTASPEEIEALAQ